MKRKIRIIALALLLIVTANWSALAIMHQSKSQDREKIALMECRKSFRSSTATEVSAYTDGKILTIEVENYDGSVYVEIRGGQSDMGGSFYCSEMGYEEFDIASFPTGTYTLTIVLENKAYSGFFLK